MSGFVRYTVAALMIFWPVLLALPNAIAWVLRGERKRPTHTGGE